MLWDEGTWEPVGDPRSAYEKGRLTFVLQGKRLKGEWHLVRMGGRTSGKRDNWLLIKSHDQYADEKNGDRALERYNTSAASGRSMTAIARGNKQWKSKVAKTSRRAKPAKARKTVKKTAKKTAKKATKASKRKSAKDAGDPPPRFIEPQLATLVGEPPSGDIWVHEIKFDGYRALCRISKGEVRLLTRSNNDWTEKFQSIADQMADLPIANAILDGEITSSEMSGHDVVRSPAAGLE